MKFETHLHTAEVSPCSRVDAVTAVREYNRAGYDGIVVTDHFCADVLGTFPGSPREKADRFLTGYRLAKEEGERLGLTVLLGAEICLDQGPEDFLLYGLDPNFFLIYPDLYHASLRELSKVVHDSGGIVVQAHPFRTYCRPGEPEFLDGVEIYNGNPRHNSRNHLALAFAEVNALTVRTSGSDYHQLPDTGQGGMIFDNPVQTEQAFKNALLEQKGTLIFGGESKEE